MDYQVTASLVTYRNKPEILRQVVKSFLSSNLLVHLFVSDNSPDDALRVEFEGKDNITYVYNDANLGFGAGHNVAIKLALKHTKYHLILNPDVYFDSEVLPKLFAYMEANKAYSLVAPQILYPDNSLQNSARLLPNLFEQVFRRLPGISYIFGAYLKNRSLESLIKHDSPVSIPFLLGCFLFIRKEAIEAIEGFDERFFMYMEDVDLCRRAAQWGPTIYNPSVHVFHIYERGSAKSFKLLKMHITSMVQYYNKWGWLIDSQRSKTNEATLASLRSM